MTPPDQDAIIRLLPCYRVGQLEPHEADAVRRALHADPSLRVLLAAVQDAERLCAATLRQGAPAGLRRLASDQVPTPSRLSAAWSWLAAVAVAASLLGLVGSGSGRTPVPGALAPLGDLVVAARLDDRDLLRADTPIGLHQALLAAGVSPALSHVADLRPLGLTLAGAVVRGERVAVVWRDAEGRAVLCVMGPPLPIHRTPDQVHRPDTGDLPVLQGHSLQGFSVLYWEQHGLGCALVAGTDLDALAAVAFQAVWKPPGA